jgi:hypothetical protein
LTLVVVGTELGCVCFRQRVSTLILSAVRWVHNSAMATFSEAPNGRWNRLGPKQTISDSRSLDWRINDHPHSIPMSAYFDPRPPRINAGNQ